MAERPCAKRVELLAEIKRGDKARVTIEVAQGMDEQQQPRRFVVLRGLRLSPLGEWRQRKSFAVLRDELRDVAAALLRAAR